MHLHAWVDEKQSYSPPVTGLASVDVRSDELAKAVFYGITNITQRCRKCGEVKVIQVSGRV